MITFYRNTDTGLSVLSQPILNCWINVVDPTPEEINQLKDLGIPQDYITYALDRDERSRTERENGDLLIIIRTPYFQGISADVPYTTIPMGIILSHQYIVTVCKHDNDVLHEFCSGRMKDLSTAKRNRFILRVLLATANKFLFCLRDITRRVDAVEDELQQSTRNREVLELLKFEKSLTYFTTALKSNELTMERLQRSQMFKAYPDDEDLLEDVLTENQQAIEMTNIESNILSGMMDAFASIISNNLNGVMKFLASITIVLSIPTMVASFYGMNIHLPLEEHPYALIIMIAVSLMLSGTVGIVFYKKDWF
jgi:magnesium transporter